MKYSLHVTLAGALLGLPLFTGAQQPLRPDMPQIGAVESTYVKVANGVYMDIRLMQRSQPPGTHVRDSAIAPTPGAGNDPNLPGQRTDLRYCGPPL